MPYNLKLCYAIKNHNWGVDPNLFTIDAGLKGFYRLTSISYLPSDFRPFTATMEAINYSFTGT
jgi:hypothetical protein